MVWAWGVYWALSRSFSKTKGAAAPLVDMVQPQQVPNQVQQESDTIPVDRLVFKRTARLSAPGKKQLPGREDSHATDRRRQSSHDRTPTRNETDVGHHNHDIIRAFYHLQAGLVQKVRRPTCLVAREASPFGNVKSPACIRDPPELIGARGCEAAGELVKSFYVRGR